MTKATFGVMLGQVSGAVAAGSGVVYGSHGLAAAIALWAVSAVLAVTAMTVVRREATR